MPLLDEKLGKFLEKRTQSHALRSLLVTQHWVDFSSNDYLSLARNPEIRSWVEREFHSNDSSSFLGATGSRLLSGNSSLHEQVEQELAEIHQTPAALLFTSGYMASLGVLSAIPQKGDTIIYDEYSHACLKDGARLSLAKHFSFRHNDWEDLERKIQKAESIVFVVVESIYSMDGDTTGLLQLVQLQKKYDFVLIIDEAHSSGIYGKGGSGLFAELYGFQENTIRIHTFGKAIGSHGACVVCSETVKKYLINFARSFIYTTAADPHSLQTIRCAYRWIASHPTLKNDLQNRISFFRSTMEGHGLESISETAIQPVLVAGNENVRRVAKTIQSQNMDVRAILSPTVPAGKERLRISLHTHNTDQEIKTLVDVLAKEIQP